MNCVTLTPTELAMQIFREYVPNGHIFNIIAAQNGSVLHITYGLSGNESYHHNLDLNDPDGIENLRLEVLLNDRYH